MRTWQLLLVLLALLASGTQQLVQQTHWHVAAAAAGVGAGVPDEGAGDHDDCLLCQIAAHAGAAAPPAAMPLHALPSRAYAACVPAASSLVAAVAPAHAWQSRGPPVV